MAIGYQQITQAGTISNMTTPGSTETVAANDDLFLHVKTTGTITNITFSDPGVTPSGSPAAGLVTTAVAMAATQERFIYAPPTLASLTTGLVTANFSSLTGVTAEWLRM